MDQIKPILQIMFQYRFWIACGLVAPLILGSWFTTTASMVKDTDAGKTRIEASYGQGKAIEGKRPHPNDTSHVEMDKYVTRLTNEVRDAWQQQYKEQAGVLVWPAELGPDFIRQVDKYRPIESFPFQPGQVTGELRVDYREFYRNYIKNELPKLAVAIGAEWRASAQAAGASGMDGAMGAGMGGADSLGGMPGAAMPGGTGFGAEGGLATGAVARPTGPPVKVIWDPADQTRLQNSRFDWSTLPEKVPRTLDILYAQEDLWVLQALMGIVAETNSGATARYNATVKEIKYIQLGREVGRSTSRVTRITAGPAGGGMGMGMGMDAGMGMMGAESGGMGMGMGMDNMGAAPGMEMGGAGMGMGMAGMGMGMGMGAEGAGAAATPDPANNRYVDNNYQPIAADRLRAALTSESPSPDDAFLVVAKRIPIRLGLVMDQRRINQFIAACGNSKLMVEVRQVRVNKIGSPTGGGGGDMGMGGMGMGGMGMGGMGMGMPSDMGDSESGGAGLLSGASGAGYGSGMMGGAAGMGGGQPGTRFSDTSPYDLPVEVYGMIYIYNPVDTRKLAIELVTADTPPAGEPGAEAAAGGEPAAATESATGTEPAGAANPAAPAESAPAQPAPAAPAPAATPPAANPAA